MIINTFILLSLYIHVYAWRNAKPPFCFQGKVQLICYEQRKRIVANMQQILRRLL